MKLELKHIVGYLPYGLKAIRLEWKEIFTLIAMDVDMSFFRLQYPNSKINMNEVLGRFKPILRPLSDLTKEIEYNGETFVPIIELGIRESKESLKTLPVKLHLKEIPDIAFSIRGFYSREYLKPSKMQKLYEWHFDIHGLIDKGLAIDFNTLKS